MASLMQRSLPKVEIEPFSGEASRWVEFIVKFRDVVHDQPFLTDRQRNQQLVQHLRGEAKRAVKEYMNDPWGYPRSLKRLKYLFGQRSTIVKAVLSDITTGQQVTAKNTDDLAELYYSLSRCITTLQQLNYIDDLDSCDVLDKVLRRLPIRLSLKWAEWSLVLRKKGMESNLLHLERWLKDRVLAQKDVYPTDDHG